MNGKRMCQSYEIIDSRRVGDTEVVLGYSPTEVSPTSPGSVMPTTISRGTTMAVISETSRPPGRI
ncbi:MAG: hypothetical protein ACLTYN_06365 [Dysosmobacter welbionis]